jgi:hypothetical protein
MAGEFGLFSATPQTAPLTERKARSFHPRMRVKGMRRVKHFCIFPDSLGESVSWHGSCFVIVLQEFYSGGMMRIKANTVIPLCTAWLAGFWAVYGFIRHGFWHRVRGPLPGFVPSIMAAVMFVISLLGVVQSFKEEDGPDRLENWAIVLAAGAAFMLIFIVGMIPALLAFVFCWLKIYEKAGWKNTITVMLICFAIVFGVFSLWLGLPFPKGLIVDAIIG